MNEVPPMIPVGHNLLKVVNFDHIRKRGQTKEQYYSKFSMANDYQ